MLTAIFIIRDVARLVPSRGRRLCARAASAFAPFLSRPRIIDCISCVRVFLLCACNTRVPTKRHKKSVLVCKSRNVYVYPRLEGFHLFLLACS